MLEVGGLRKRYREVQALDGVSLTVQSGEVFGFLGPNGAGKTTFTKCITGFIHRDEGTVKVCGADPEQDSVAVGRSIGLVPDQYDFYPSMTGRQHLDFYASLQEVPKTERARRVQETLATVGMEQAADRRVRGYSHGMKQRICVAQAILHRPRLVIFDEPSNGLDPRGAHDLRQVILRLAAAGTSVFLNSHVLSEVEAVCQRVAIIDKGRLVATGSIAELQRRFGSTQTTQIRLKALPKAVLAAVRSLAPNAKAIDRDTLEVPAGIDMTQLLHRLAQAGGEVLEVRRHEASLEDLFLQLTQRST